MFLGVLKVVTNNIYFRQQYDFPLNVFVMWLILIQKNTYCQWIEIEEYPKYKFYDNIWDLSIRSFWYHSNETKRSPCVMLCSLCPIKDSSGYYRLLFTFIPERVTKSQKVHKPSHDGLQNFITPTFLDTGPMIFQSENRVVGISSFPHKILNLSSNSSIIFWLQLIHHINICTKPWFPIKIFLILN